ncbi:hypothetical protein BO443_30063 [Burkholderia orbicola]
MLIIVELMSEIVLNDNQTYNCANEDEARFSRTSSDFMAAHLAEEKEISNMSRNASSSGLAC